MRLFDFRILKSYKVSRNIEKNRWRSLKQIQYVKDEKFKKLFENAENLSMTTNIQTIQVKFEKLDKLKEKYLERELTKPFEDIIYKMMAVKKINVAEIMLKSKEAAAKRSLLQHRKEMATILNKQKK